jgi:hypothetical protein
MAAAYVRLGKLDEACALVAQVRLTLRDQTVWSAWKNAQYAASVLEPCLDLAKAGMPGNSRGPQARRRGL